MTANRRILNVGGCGEVAQVIHIPTLNHFNEFFRITYLCDVSQQALDFCASKVSSTSAPKLTKDAAELCASHDVDIVMVINSTEYHAPHATLALQNDKITFIEKPMAINSADAAMILDAERKSKGKVFVGYMRRYAAVFADAIKEIGSMDKILYARVRDIIGPNPYFVGQSGTFPKRFSDYAKSDLEDKSRRERETVAISLQKDLDIPVTKESSALWFLLGNLGSHDLSLMREALGMPQGVIGSYFNNDGPFWNALFQYPGFACSYESGIDNIPRFDAHIEVYSRTKQVLVQYDTPFVKGLPVTMTIRENVDGVYQERFVRRTYEDPYTLEYKELYAMATEGKQAKTTAEDAVQDLKVFQMIMQSAKAQFEAS